MKQLENYHYASLLFSLAGMSQGMNIVKKTDGLGLSQKTYFILSSSDERFNVTLSFFTYPTSANPYKKELYDFVNYLSDRSTTTDFRGNLNNDTELFRRITYFFNSYLHLCDVKLRFAKSQDERTAIFSDFVSPAKNFQTWRIETEKNFIPFCREHIILTATEELTKRVVLNNKLAPNNKLHSSDLKDTISQALQKFGFTQKQIDEMYAESDKNPIEQSPSTTQMQ